MKGKPPENPECARAQCYVVLRQNYLQNSEAQVNEWHRQFLEKRAAAAQQGDGGGDKASVRSMRSGWMKDAVKNLNPNRQVCCCRPLARTPDISLPW